MAKPPKYSPQEMKEHYPLALGTLVHRAVALPFTKPKKLSGAWKDRHDFLKREWRNARETLRYGMEEFIEGWEYPLRDVADQAGESWGEIVGTFGGFDKRHQAALVSDTIKVAKRAHEEFLHYARKQGWRSIYCEVPLHDFGSDPIPTIKRADLIAYASRPYSEGANNWEPGYQIFDLKTTAKIPGRAALSYEKHGKGLEETYALFTAQQPARSTPPQMTVLYVGTAPQPEAKTFLHEIPAPQKEGTAA